MQQTPTPTVAVMEMTKKKVGNTTSSWVDDVYLYRYKEILYTIENTVYFELMLCAILLLTRIDSAFRRINLPPASWLVAWKESLADRAAIQNSQPPTFQPAALTRAYHRSR